LHDHGVAESLQQRPDSFAPPLHLAPGVVVANAVFDASGVGLRQMPFIPTDWVWSRIAGLTESSLTWFSWSSSSVLKTHRTTLCDGNQKLAIWPGLSGEPVWSRNRDWSLYSYRSTQRSAPGVWPPFRLGLFAGWRRSHQRTSLSYI